MEILPEICSEIAEVSDLETAKNICRAFAGCQVYFPLLGKAERHSERNKAIFRDKQNGMSWPSMVQKYGLSERGLRYIIAGIKNQQENE